MRKLALALLAALLGLASFAQQASMTRIDFESDAAGHNDVRTFWSGNHTQGCAFGQPLLVLDMYEHSYALDYGAAAGKYLDAFFQNVNWEEVDRRLERAEKMPPIHALDRTGDAP